VLISPVWETICGSISSIQATLMISCQLCVVGGAIDEMGHSLFRVVGELIDASVEISVEMICCAIRGRRQLFGVQCQSIAVLASGDSRSSVGFAALLRQSRVCHEG